MADDYNLGTAHGVIKIDYDGQGATAATAGLRGLNTTAQGTSQSLRGMGVVASAAGGLIAGGFIAAISSAADFEQRLSAIEAVSGATAAEMDLVREKALQLGRDTKFSAGESAVAMEELIKAGLSVADVMGGAADATVALAAAGEISLPEAATVAANAMNQFNLAAADLPRVADLIAGAANASAIGVSDFAMSLQQSGGVANLAGLEFGDLATAIALMGNEGYRGSDAGTSLKTMFLNLQPVTAKQRAEFERLNIVTADGANKFFDATGSAKSFGEISEVLKQSLAGMTDQQKLASLEILFGSDAIRAAAVAASNGAEGFDLMNEAMGNVTAADVAATRMDNFRGTLEQLRGSVETFMIVVGTPFLGALNSVTAAFTDVINAITNAPAFIRIAATGIGILLAGVLLLSGALLLVVPRINATTTALGTMGARGIFAANALKGVGSFLLGPWGLAIAAATIGIGYFIHKHAEAEQASKDLRATLDQETGAMTDNTRAYIANQLEVDGLIDKANELGLHEGTLTSAILGDPAAIKDTQTAIEGALKAFSDAQNFKTEGGITDDLRSQMEAALALRAEYPQLADDLQTQIETQQRLGAEVGNTTDELQTGALGLGEYAVQGEVVTSALGETTKATQAVDDAVSEFQSSLDRLFQTTAGVSEAQDNLTTKVHGLEDSIRTAADAGEAFNFTLDGTSQAAVDNRDTLRGMIDGLKDVTTQGIKAGDTEAIVTQRYQDGRQALIDKLVALGYNAEAVQTLIDTEGNIQPLIDTYFNTPGLEDATTRVGLHDDAIRGVPLTWDSVFAADTEDASLKAQTFSRLADDAARDRTMKITVEWAESPFNPGNHPGTEQSGSRMAGGGLTGLSDGALLAGAGSGTGGTGARSGSTGGASGFGSWALPQMNEAGGGGGIKITVPSKPQQGDVTYKFENHNHYPVEESDSFKESDMARFVARVGIHEPVGRFAVEAP